VHSFYTLPYLPQRATVLNVLKPDRPTALVRQQSAIRRIKKQLLWQGKSINRHTHVLCLQHWVYKQHSSNHQYLFSRAYSFGNQCCLCRNVRTLSLGRL